MKLYDVRPGDTLAGIARRFGLSVCELAQANGIADPNHIAAGQRLAIPIDDDDAGAATAPGRPPPPSPAKKSDPNQWGSHAWARNVVRAALEAYLKRQPVEAEIQAAQAVGWLETKYGQGWNPKTQANMVGSNNWGATQGTMRTDAEGKCPPGYAPQADSDPDKKAQYQACFRLYETPELGAFDMVKAMYGRSVAPTRRGPSVPDAIASGASDAVSAAMWVRGYFEGFDDKANGRSLARTRLDNHSIAFQDGVRQACAAQGIAPAFARRELAPLAVQYRRRKGEPKKPAKGWDAEATLDPAWFSLDNNPIPSPDPAAPGGGGGGGLILFALLGVAAWSLLE